MRQTAAAHSAARRRRPLRAWRRRLGAYALPAVLGWLRYYRSRHAGRVDSHDRRPAEARQGGTGEKDRGKPRTSDQHGRHMRARPGGRAGALPSRIAFKRRSSSRDRAGRDNISRLRGKRRSSCSWRSFNSSRPPQTRSRFSRAEEIAARWVRFSSGLPRVWARRIW